MALLGTRGDPFEGPPGEETGQSAEFIEGVVQRLEPLVQVPRLGIEQFVRLRSDKSAADLDRILQDVERSTLTGRRSATPGEVGQFADTLHPSGCQTARAAPTAGDAERRAETPSEIQGNYNVVTGADGRAAAKLHKYWKDSGYALCSSSTRFFGGSRPGMSKTKPVNAAVFDELWKPELSDALADWRGEAAPGDVEHLAQSLRGLRYIASNVTGIGKKHTEHRAKYIRHRKASTERRSTDGARNLSQVPLGSIYSTDPWEIQAHQKRLNDIKVGIARQAQQQELTKTAYRLPKKEMTLIAVKPETVKRTRVTEVSQCLQSYMRSGQKSEYRAQYIAMMEK